MDLLPYPIGPLNPRVEHLVIALALFALAYHVVSRLLPRINRVLAEREEATEGARRRAEAVLAEAEEKRAETASVLAEARHDAARTRQQAREQGSGLVAAARADGRRECDALLAGERARTAAEHAAAEAELRMYVSELASDLASRVVGERITSRAEPRS
ncbi:F0F1 ATP synthase subunit B family protein [Streptomyces poonensis]|uniref:ATP synthase subunit b n=1 Tax=Streptomyces poonensis TaxID=68255 RepID=A0A918QC18_9ACTN|nr:hypothetical protein [Streptomyces poonensis]GGZ38454.1 ATP synthase subunit b [Streptomyces poonensis]GLJ92043.1 ATP synthase subunit b [Streptomyces poonensis]